MRGGGAAGRSSWCGRRLSPISHHPPVSMETAGTGPLKRPSERAHWAPHATPHPEVQPPLVCGTEREAPGAVQSRGLGPRAPRQPCRPALSRPALRPEGHTQPWVHVQNLCFFPSTMAPVAPPGPHPRGARTRLSRGGRAPRQTSTEGGASSTSPTYNEKLTLGERGSSNQCRAHCHGNHHRHPATRAAVPSASIS